MKQLKSITICFAGDSGDGIQVMGSQMCNASVLSGNNIQSFSDFPSESFSGLCLDRDPSSFEASKVFSTATAS